MKIDLPDDHFDGATQLVTTFHGFFSRSIIDAKGRPSVTLTVEAKDAAALLDFVGEQGARLHVAVLRRPRLDA